MTFYTFLRKQARRDDPIGDLARDVIADKKCGHDQCKSHCRPSSYAGILRHILAAHHPSAEFLDALDAA